MITIQRATTNDAATIAGVGKRSFVESHGHSAAAADIDSYVSKKYSTAAVSAELQDAGNIYHLIAFNGQVAGYSKIRLNAAHEGIPRSNASTLDRLYLLKDFYDLKLGHTLLQFNIDLSKQAAQTGMWLYTWTENTRAVTFYKKTGFRIIADTFFKISETHSNPNYLMYLEY